MPGQRGSENRRMPHAVTIRMGDDLMALCAKAASAQDLSSSAWLRCMAADAVGLKQEGVKRSRPRASAKPASPELIQSLVKLANLIADINKVVTDLAGEMFAEMDNDQPSPLNSLLPVICAASEITVSAIELAGRP